MIWRTVFGALLVSTLAVGNVKSELKKETIEYRDGATVLEGYLVYDDARKGIRPGILVIHDWMGLGEESNARVRCEMLARLGYVAFAADMYGKGVRPKNRDEAAAEAGKFYKDRALFRSRAVLALSYLKSRPEVDSNQLAAIGYCYGGTGVLELARSGATLAGVVTFHGGLAANSPDDAKNIRCKVLVLHGADDPYVPADQVAAFEKEMTEAKVDWQLVKYSGAVHSFSNPAAGNDASTGAAYNQAADNRSWIAMKNFFEEILGEK
jgi:dienelactone hydrolase